MLLFSDINLPTFGAILCAHKSIFTRKNAFLREKEHFYAEKSYDKMISPLPPESRYCTGYQATILFLVPAEFDPKISDFSRRGRGELPNLYLSKIGSTLAVIPFPTPTHRSVTGFYFIIPVTYCRCRRKRYFGRKWLRGFATPADGQTWSKSPLTAERSPDLFGFIVQFIWTFFNWGQL